MRHLLLAFEREAYPIGQLAKKLKQEGHKVLVFCVDHWFITHGGNGIFKYLIDQCGLEQNEIFNLSGFYKDINKISNQITQEEVDWKYLAKFEEEYLLSDARLSKILSSDTLFYRVFHHRETHFIPSNKTIYYKSLEILVRQIEKIILDFKPELVFTIQNQYAIKRLFYEISRKHSTPFLTLFVSRIESKWIISSNFHTGICPITKKEVEEKIQRSDSFTDAQDYIFRLNNSLKSAYTSHNHILDNIHNSFNIFHRLKNSLKITLYLSKIYLSGMVVHYRSVFSKDYFLPNYFSSVYHEIRGILRMRKYRKSKELNNKILPNGPFIYFSLHVMPESSTSTLSTTLNEFECIYQLSKVLVVDWKIVVKVNPGMLSGIDTHPNSYYKRINQIPSVYFIDPTYPSLEIIKKSNAVASLAGTSLLEAAILGKPAFCWGTPEFYYIDGVYLFDPQTFNSNLVKSIEQTKALHYVQYCFENGIDIDAKKLMHSSKNVNNIDYQNTIDKINELLCAKNNSILEHHNIG